MAYFDEILIYNKFLDEHIMHVKSILVVLCNEQLYDNLKKYTFFMQKVSFLSFIVSVKGIEVDQKNVNAIQE